MGMGYCANSCWTLTTDVINKLAKKEANELSKLLKKFDVTLEEFARYNCYGAELPTLTGNDRDIDCLDKAYTKLFKALKKKTKLSICIAYHDGQNDGDRYDDVNGVFWEVDGVEKMTPAGKRLQDKLKFSRWVTYG